MTEITMHRTRISGQDWSGFKPGPAPTVSAPYEAEETTLVPVGELERLRKALKVCLDDVNKAGGTALGVAMSGKNHPNPDGALMDVFQSCQEAAVKASDALSEGKS